MKRGYIPPSRRCGVCQGWTVRPNRHCLRCDPERRAFAISLYQRRSAGERESHIARDVHLCEASVGKWCRIGQRYVQEERATL